MTIDEAIEELKSENGYYANNGMIDVAEFNTKIIRWLEELKKYKEKPEGYLWDEAVQQGYNKAIDDAKSVILQTLDNEILVDTLHLRLEQLKRGKL